MKYKLYNEVKTTPLKQILLNRGIENIDKWLNADWNDINNPFLFGEERVNKAINFLRDIFKWEPKEWNNNFPQGQKICVIVDADCDGCTSAAIIINYLTELMKHHDYCSPQENIQYILHSNKQHGLEDTYEQINDDIELVIIPDAATNDIEYLKRLSKRGIKVLVMD